MIRLSDVQADAVTLVVERVSELRRSLGRPPRVLVVGPTGVGKTIVGAAILRHYLRSTEEKLLWIAPGPALALHAARDLLRSGHHDIGFCAAGVRRYVPTPRLVVASAYTLARRSVPEVSIVLWDEAHACEAPTYRKILAELPGATHLLLTATPFHGSRGLDPSLYDATVVIGNSADLARRGLLAPVRIVNPREKDPVRLWERYKGPAFYFLRSRAETLSVVQALRAAGARAEAVLQDTSTTEREKLYQGMRDGKVDVVAGIGTFVEGIDVPPLRVVAFLHNVSSRKKWKQAIGRARRLHPSKTEAIVLDCGSSARLHGLADEDEVPLAPKLVTCETCGTVSREKCERHIDSYLPKP